MHFIQIYNSWHTFFKLLWVDLVRIEHAFIRFSHEEPLNFCIPGCHLEAIWKFLQFQAFSSSEIKVNIEFLQLHMSYFWSVSFWVLNFIWFGSIFWQLWGRKILGFLLNIFLYYSEFKFWWEDIWWVGENLLACAGSCDIIGVLLRKNRIGSTPNRESLKLLCEFCVTKVF